MVDSCSEVAKSDVKKESEARCKAMLDKLISEVKKQTVEMEDLAIRMNEITVGLKAIVQPQEAPVHALPPPGTAPTATLVTVVDHAMAAATPSADTDPTAKRPARCSTVCIDRDTSVHTSASTLATTPSASPTITELDAASSRVVAAQPDVNAFTTGTVSVTPTKCSTEGEEHAIDTNHDVVTTGFDTEVPTNCLTKGPRLDINDIGITNLAIELLVGPEGMLFGFAINDGHTSILDNACLRACSCGAMEFRQPWPPPAQVGVMGYGVELRPTSRLSFKGYRGGVKGMPSWSPPVPGRMLILEKGFCPAINFTEVILRAQTRGVLNIFYQCDGNCSPFWNGMGNLLCLLSRQDVMGCHSELTRSVAGADVNRKLFLGYATTAAAHEGNIDILEMLLQAGATQEVCEDALSEASLFGEAEAIRLLVFSEMLGPEAAAQALVIASSRGFDDAVVILLHNGVDVNCMARVLLRSVKPALHANVDCTPLMVSAWARHPDCFLELIKFGADLGIVNNAGDTAIMRVKKSSFRSSIGGNDELLPSREEAERLCGTLEKCIIRHFKDNGHKILLEGEFDLATTIKGAGNYRRSRRTDFVSDFLPPLPDELEKAMDHDRILSFPTNPVMLSTLPDGKIVRGLTGLPKEGPAVLVGYHMLMGFELGPLVTGVLNIGINLDRVVEIVVKSINLHVEALTE